MRVVLVGAEFEENLAVRYLWAALEAAGHEVVQVVFNERAELPRAADAIAQADAGVVGLSMVFTARAREFAELATLARARGHRGVIVAGGHFAAFHAETLLREVPAIDAVCTCEGEQPLCRLAADPSALGSIPGFVWRRGPDLVRNPAADKPCDLDILPVPPRKTPFDQYLGLGITNLLGSRGCVHGCSFCSIVAWHALTGGPRLRTRAPERIADEMADLYRRGARIFNFHDDNFFLPTAGETRARIRAIASALSARGVGRIAFAVKARPDEVDEALFCELVGMGLFRVFLGVEAGTAESLARLGRGQSLADNERALAAVNRLGVHTCFNLLLWNPSSTLEDVAANVAFLGRHPDNPMNFCRTEIYAGTPLERSLGKKGRLLGDFWGWDYRMQDARAQAMFEVVYPAFRERNYGTQGIHHLAMQVDYEEQILGHFYGRRPALRRKTKAFVVDVNRSTVRHLEAALAWAGSERAPRTCAAFVQSLTRRVHADDARLRARALSLLEEIRHAATEPRAAPMGRWRKAATAAGVAAALAACSDDTHATEMVAHPPIDAPGPPPPTPTPIPQPAPDAGITTHMTEMVPVPPPPLPEGVPAALRRQLLPQAITIFGNTVPPHLGVQIEMWIDGQGRVIRANLLHPDLYPESKQAIESALTALRFADPDVLGKRFTVRFQADEIHRPQPRRPIPTHPSEMAPMPTHPREMAPMPTHPSEMAPMPTHPSEMAPMPTHPSEMAPEPPKKK